MVKISNVRGGNVLKRRRPPSPPSPHPLAPDPRQGAKQLSREANSSAPQLPGSIPGACVLAFCGAGFVGFPRGQPPGTLDPPRVAALLRWAVFRFCANWCPLFGRSWLSTYAALASCSGTRTTARGFEPLRAEPNGFRVHLLNHSDTLSCRTASAVPGIVCKLSRICFGLAL
jgi:hypothetical protein